MYNEKKELIIKAIKQGVPQREISRRLKIPVTTLNYYMKRDKELIIAKERYLTIVENLFS